MSVATETTSSDTARLKDPLEGLVPVRLGATQWKSVTRIHPQTATQETEQAASLNENQIVVRRIPSVGDWLDNRTVVYTKAARHREARRSAERKLAGRFWLLNKWHGQVVKIGEDFFEAELTDLSKPGITEVAEFAVNDVAENQRALLRPGALFYWFVGYRDTPDGRQKGSQMWFRRSGQMDQSSFSSAREKVKNIWKALEREDVKSSSAS